MGVYQQLLQGRRGLLVGEATEKLLQRRLGEGVDGSSVGAARSRLLLPVLASMQGNATGNIISKILDQTKDPSSNKLASVKAMQVQNYD